MKVIELKKTFTESNDRDAEELRQILKEKGVFLVNLMSAAGSGKTTLLMRIIRDLKEKIRIAVLEADIASEVDAVRIETLGARSIQLHTDGMCHMDAGMTRKGLREMGIKNIDIAFLENVGNLICPAEYDTGAVKNVMILSVPEGDDKPLKYPLMFRESDALVITKIDAAPYFNFDMDKVQSRVMRINPGIRIFPVSAKTGEGMDFFERWLFDEMEIWKRAAAWPMHELGIVTHVMKTLTDVAAENEVTHIASVTLEVGEVSGVIHEQILDCWDYMCGKRGPLFTDCKLNLETIPAVTICNSCEKTYPTVQYGRTCPYCGSGETWLLNGNECTIREIEAE